jgi:hypothetical protein
LAFGKIRIWTDVGNDSIFDPDRLAFDKLSGKRIEESPIDENGIWRSVARNDLIKLHHPVHLFHIERVSYSGLRDDEILLPSRKPWGDFTCL